MRQRAYRGGGKRKEKEERMSGTKKRKWETLTLDRGRESGKPG